MKLSYSHLLLICLLLISIPAFSQQPEQDCISAIPVCQSTYVQPNSYLGDGALSELNYPVNTSCLQTGEQNSVWYIFNVSGAGQLNMTITPGNINDDYDWAIYDITNGGCVGILNGSSPEVRCNYSAFPGNTGMQNGALLTSVGPAGLPWCLPLNVLVGETYVLVINNFANTQSGYTLNFSNTAQIFDNVPPAEIGLTKTLCNPVDTLVLTLSEPVKCNSISANGSDFFVTGPSVVNVGSAGSVNCIVGLFTTTVKIVLSAPITTSGTYVLHFQNGSDGNTLLDNCNNPLPTNPSVNFSVAVLNPTFSINHILGCQQDQFIVTDQSSGSQYAGWNWDFGGIFSSNQQKDTFIYNVNGNYNITLTVTDTGGCVASNSQAVNINIVSPVAAFSVAPAVICAFDPVQFTNNSLNIVGSNWSFGDGTTSISGSPAHAYSAGGNYNVTLIVQNAIPCYDTIVIPVNVNTGVIADYVYAPSSACFGDLIQFSDASSGNPISWQWDFGGGNTSNSQNPSYTFPTTGTFPVTLITDNGICLPASVTQNILVSTYPVVDLGPDTSICYGETVTLDAQNSGYTFFWFDMSTGQTDVINMAPMWVWVEVNNNGCLSYDSLYVNSECVLAVPNAFTPNGDGLNDYFLVINQNIATFNMEIYNRWGQLLFQSDDPAKAWDGTFNGTKELTGTYVYQIHVSFINGATLAKKGNVTLIR